MVVSFRDLKNMITKVCTAKSDAKDYAEKHSFSMNMYTLNNMLVQKKLDYRVMAGTDKLGSYIPFVSDIHMITDYVESYEELMEIMDGYTQIAVFTLFSIRNKNGEIVIGEDEEHKLADKDIFAACNNHKKLDIELMSVISKQLPTYRILVARKFNPKSDSFAYNVYFRSNRQMSAFFRSEMGKKEAENEESEDDKIDLSEE